MNLKFLKGFLYQWLRLFYMIPAYIKIKINPSKYTLEEKFSLISNYAKDSLKFHNINVKINGHENLPDKNENVVFVANHANWVDAFILIKAMDRPSAMVVAKEAKWDKVPFIKDLMEMINCLHIDRVNNRNALKTINKASEILKSTSSVGVFPEGMVTLSDDITSFKDGVFRMAIKAQVPVVPIHIKNTKDILKITSRWTGKMYAKDVEVDILPPIYSHINNSMKTKELSDIVRDSIINNKNKKEFVEKTI